MGNKNSSSSKSKVHGQASNVASSKPLHNVPMQGKPSTNPNMVGFSTQQGHGTNVSTIALLRDEYTGNVVGVHSESEQQYYKALPLVDNDDTFTDFIRRAKYRIRTVTMSNVDQEQSSTPPAPAPDEVYGGNSKENQEDQFSEFIQLAKKRLRTTSSIGKNGSFKRG